MYSPQSFSTPLLFSISELSTSSMSIQLMPALRGRGAALSTCRRSLFIPRLSCQPLVQVRPVSSGPVYNHSSPQLGSSVHPDLAGILERARLSSQFKVRHIRSASSMVEFITDIYRPSTSRLPCLKKNTQSKRTVWLMRYEFQSTTSYYQPNTSNTL